MEEERGREDRTGVAQVRGSRRERLQPAARIVREPAPSRSLAVGQSGRTESALPN